MTINIKVNGESIDVKGELTKLYDKPDQIINYCVINVICAMLAMGAYIKLNSMLT